MQSLSRVGHRPGAEPIAEGARRAHLGEHAVAIGVHLVELLLVHVQLLLQVVVSVPSGGARTEVTPRAGSR